jgi:hypothetical protein
VLAVAVSARDADRPALGVRDDDGVEPVGLAGAAEVFERLARAITLRRNVHGGCYDRSFVER